MRKFEKKIKIYLQFSILYLIQFSNVKKYYMNFLYLKLKETQLNPINNSRFHKCIFFSIKINKELKIEFLNSKLAK